jgi:hypothetical protein
VLPFFASDALQLLLSVFERNLTAQTVHVSGWMNKKCEAWKKGFIYIARKCVLLGKYDERLDFLQDIRSDCPSGISPFFCPAPVYVNKGKDLDAGYQNFFRGKDQEEVVLYILFLFWNQDNRSLTVQLPSSLLLYQSLAFYLSFLQWLLNLIASSVD